MAANLEGPSGFRLHHCSNIDVFSTPVCSVGLSLSSELSSPAPTSASVLNHVLADILFVRICLAQVFALPSCVRTTSFCVEPRSTVPATLRVPTMSPPPTIKLPQISLPHQNTSLKGRKRSGSIVKVEEVGERVEELLDRSAYVNINANWVNAKGMCEGMNASIFLIVRVMSQAHG